MESCGEVFEHVELKYCEGCGGLWLRPRGAEEVYCPECAAEDGGVCETAAAPPRAGGDEPLEELESSIAELTGVTMEGGNA